jgi:hypothetical protein
MTLSALGIFSAAGAGEVGATYELISSTILGSSQASVIFDVSSFASTYKHLQIRLVARSDETGSSNLRDLRIQVNADTGTNYSSHRLRGDGSGVFSDASTSQNAIFGGAMFPRPSNPTTEYGAAIIDVLDVYSTTKNTTFRVLGGAKPTGEDQILLSSGAWLNTNALTEIKLFANAGNLATGSRASIYGIRG